MIAPDYSKHKTIKSIQTIQINSTLIGTQKQSTFTILRLTFAKSVELEEFMNSKLMHHKHNTMQSHELKLLF